MDNLTFSKSIWPPDVTVKKHPRARHIKLKASIESGLELVVPVRFNIKEVPFILEQNRAWIEKQLLKLQTQVATVDEPEILPSMIEFLAINQTWHIEYIPSKTKLQIITRPHNRLVLLGNITNNKTCKALLIHWMKHHAKLFLLEQLKLISEQVKLSYTNATVRDQRSRWGSCSSEKSISLNYKLLFLPYALMRHVIIHELCHTVHLNHSEKFWKLVEKFDTDLKIHQKQLRHANEFIPKWIKS